MNVSTKISPASGADLFEDHGARLIDCQPESSCVL